MKCKEIRTVAKHRSIMFPTAAVDATTHMRACKRCQDLLLLDKLTPAIIRAASASDFEDSHAAPSPILINKIRSRIREIREQRSSSWELAIESMRGWLAAFAATAVILIAASIQWQPSVITSDFDHDGDESITQNPGEYLISDIPDLGSIGKDNPYAHK